MCGIAGHAARGASDRTVDVEAARRALRHRGPDASGVRHWSGAGVTWELVHTRLSIVDLSAAGNEPMDNEDGTLVLVFNGEIYNHRELRRRCEANGHSFRSDCDGEVILHLWEDLGTAAVAELNGIFAFAVASTVTGEVWLARDPFGVKPLVYCRDGDELWFASEVAGLRWLGAPMGRDDTVALAQFLSFLWVPDPRSPYENARSLGPGEVLHWAAGSSSTTCVVDLIRDADGGASDPGDARDRLCEAVERQLQADVPVSLMASGGVDSSLLWWAAGRGVAHAYTIDSTSAAGAEGLHEDAEAVRELHAALGTPVVWIDEQQGGSLVELPASGDLFADPAFHLTRSIARRASTLGEKVLLSGQGADELFGGYRRHRIVPALERLHLGSAGRWIAAALARAPSDSTAIEYAGRLARAAAERDPVRGYLQLCTYSSAADRARALDVTSAEVADDVVWEAHLRAFERTPATWPLSRRLRAVDVAVYLPGLGLAYADRAGMEFGVEIRVPFLDLDLARWALRLPESALVRRGSTKVVLRDLAAAELPPVVANRPKRGFAVTTSRVRETAGSTGERGFRQAAYFSLAVAMLERHLASAGRR